MIRKKKVNDELSVKLHVNDFFNIANVLESLSEMIAIMLRYPTMFARDFLKHRRLAAFICLLSQLFTFAESLLSSMAWAELLCDSLWKFIKIEILNRLACCPFHLSQALSHDYLPTTHPFDQTQALVSVWWKTFTINILFVVCFFFAIPIFVTDTRTSWRQCKTHFASSSSYYFDHCAFASAVDKVSINSGLPSIFFEIELKFFFCLDVNNKSEAGT